MRRTFLCKFFLGGVVACLASAAAMGWADTLYSEDWESGSIDAADWTMWGYPDRYCRAAEMPWAITRSIQTAIVLARIRRPLLQQYRKSLRLDSGGPVARTVSDPAADSRWPWSRRTAIAPALGESLGRSSKEVDE